MKKILYSLMLLFIANNASAQETPDINNSYHPVNLSAQQQKSMIGATDNLYNIYYKIVINAKSNSISRNLIDNFCITGFWPGAFIETLSPITKKKQNLTPKQYFDWLYRVYKTKYDSTSNINIVKNTLNPKLTIDKQDGNYMVVYDVSQTVINRRGNAIIYADSTNKNIYIKFKFDKDNHPRIERIEAINSFLK